MNLLKILNWEMQDKHLEDVQSLSRVLYFVNKNEDIEGIVKIIVSSTFARQVANSLFNDSFRAERCISRISLKSLGGYLDVVNLDHMLTHLYDEDVASMFLEQLNEELKTFNEDTSHDL